MTEQVDVIIIGAGIIGAATAFELAKNGVRTLSIDKNPAAGYGPTAASCAIIRVHYSTFEGTAFAYEGYYYWRDWPGYIGVEDERGLAEFRENGCLVMQTTTNDYLTKHIANCRDLDIPFEIWDAKKIGEVLPIFDLNGFGPPKPMSDADFGQPVDEPVKSGVYWPTAGYVTDPQLATHNLQRAAESHGAKFLFGRRVVEILKTDDRIAGVRLDDGQMINSPVVVNVAGPHSSIINEMAGALDDMTISTRALKQEVVHVPAPSGYAYFDRAPVTSDSDIGVYSRPEHGDNILLGSEDPECDPREWVDPDDYDQNFTDQSTVQVHRFAQRVPTLGIPNQVKGVVDLYDVTDDHDTSPLTFHLPYVDRDIDVGFYSRKRKINRESSFSVLG